LLLLLGARHNEIAGMPWSELDFAAGTWTLPKERSKNKRPLILVLPKAALNILAAQPRRPGDLYVFGPRQGGLLLSSRLTDALNRRLGDQVAHWTPHDLRRTAATRMCDVGIAPHIVEAALNHYSGHRAGIAGTYNRSQYTGEVTAALARWSEHLLALVEGRAADNVIPLRGAS
jgi:integrase